MQRHDVIIIGGGPGGSSCAWALRRAGLDVLVLDRRTFPRDKTCAGWITPPVVDVLQLDLDEYRRGRTCQPITGFLTGVIGGREISTDYGRPVSYGIRRCEFDHYLLARSGAALRLGEAVKSLERRDGRWIVNDETEAPLLVGAGGHFCPVARMLNGKPDPGQNGGREQAASAPTVYAQEIEFEAPPDELERGRVAGEVPQLYFCRDMRGYGWCFRKENWLNIGLGRIAADGLAEHVRQFCETLRRQGKIACELPPRFHGHAYRLYERAVPRLTGEGVLLIGDAAGLAYANSGEGIRPAVESGLIAAEVIAAMAGTAAADLVRYEERILSRFGRPRAHPPADWLPAAWLHFLARRLMATRWFARRVVLDGWFLHASEEPLRREAILQ